MIWKIWSIPGPPSWDLQFLTLRIMNWPNLQENWIRCVIEKQFLQILASFKNYHLECSDIWETQNTLSIWSKVFFSFRILASLSREVTKLPLFMMVFIYLVVPLKASSWRPIWTLHKSIAIIKNLLMTWEISYSNKSMR